MFQHSSSQFKCFSPDAVLAGTAGIIQGLLLPLRACLLLPDMHPQSRAFLLSSALGAALQALEEQAQAAVSGKARGSATLRASLAAQLQLDVEALRGELGHYEAYAREQPEEPGGTDCGLAESAAAMRKRLMLFEGGWCSEEEALLIRPGGRK